MKITPKHIMFGAASLCILFTIMSGFNTKAASSTYQCEKATETLSVTWNRLNEIQVRLDEELDRQNAVFGGEKQELEDIKKDLSDTASAIRGELGL